MRSVIKQIEAAELELSAHKDAKPDATDTSELEAAIRAARGDLNAKVEQLNVSGESARKARDEMHQAEMALATLRREAVEANEGRDLHESRVARVKGQLEEAKRIQFDEPEVPDESDIEAARVLADQASDAMRRAEKDSLMVKARANAVAAHERRGDLGPHRAACQRQRARPARKAAQEKDRGGQQVGVCRRALGRCRG